MTHTLSKNNIEAELSYAFLHAIAANAKAECVSGGRISDSNGIDAHLTSWGPFFGSQRKEVDLKIQLKATARQPNDNGTHFSYTLKKRSQYDELREHAYSTPRILVVLFLPKDESTWLEVTADSLTLKKCAYWVSLIDAPEVSIESPTIYIPKKNVLTPKALSDLFNSVAQGKLPTYAGVGI